MVPVNNFEKRKALFLVPVQLHYLDREEEKITLSRHGRHSSHKLHMGILGHLIQREKKEASSSLTPSEGKQDYDSWFVEGVFKGQNGFMVWLCKVYLFRIGNHEASDDWQELKASSFEQYSAEYGTGQDFKSVVKTESTFRSNVGVVIAADAILVMHAI